MKNFNVFLCGSFILNGVLMDLVNVYCNGDAIECDCVNNINGEIETMCLAELDVDFQIKVLGEIERITNIDLDFRNI